MCPNYLVKSFKVCVGVLNRKETQDAQCFESSTFYAHPNYACCSTDNSKDIAIIKIKEGIDLPKFTSDGRGSTNAICLPPASDAEKDYSGQAIIAGFGRTDSNSNDIAKTLQIGTVKLLSTSECQQSYGAFSVDKTHVCAFSDDTSSCNGDSGSALYTENNYGVKTAIGVTSFGRINCKGNPVVYTKVAAYRDFIDKYSGSSNN
ncbi:chymotrypsin-like protease CTRL-1 [Leptotrombidium deliense]|uniref:Chymotrypsin-like protease CTRL-1 n=1 Tax=Leptotrombidium deliense TaxID=299467 RepID=A0A443RXA2_9ACAR|nr:chymotrypsin-like protease CTRL-1 [Leptotrombidium deliense]